MKLVVRSRLFPIALVISAAIATACSDQGPVGGRSGTDISGLDRVVAKDSGSGGPYPTEPAPAPGYIHGTVLGAGYGADTLSNPTRLASVRVAAFPREPIPGDSLHTGPQVAAVTTDGNGEFQLPKLPAGAYLVTFTPPQGSAYRGAYVSTTVNAQTGSYPWWIFLQPK